MKKLNLVGQRFAMLTVVEKAHSKKVQGGTVVYWTCKCDCGNTTLKATAALRTGKDKSCGCYKHARIGNQSRTHGMSNTKVYELWSAMIQRAKGNRAKSYPERGITCCPEWESFENFLADMGEPKPGDSLERVDNDKGYSKDNCVWLPMKDQWRNRTNTKFYDYNGKKMTLREIAEEVGMNQATLRHRIVVQGLTIEEATKSGRRVPKKHSDLLRSAS